MLSTVDRNLFLFCTDDDDMFSNVFCENSKKLINVHLFALAAKYYSLSNLGVCTPLEDVLEALRGDNQGTTGIFTFVFKFLLTHYRTFGFGEWFVGVFSYMLLTSIFICS